jgi:hypothetical protein
MVMFALIMFWRALLTHVMSETVLADRARPYCSSDEQQTITSEQ